MKKFLILGLIPLLLLVPVNVFAIEYNEQGLPKTYLKGNFHECNDGLWIGSFEVEGTGEKITQAKVFIYGENGVRTKITSLYPDGTLRISPDGNNDYPLIEWVLVRSTPHEDFTFSPICFELPDWIKSTALWWSADAITDEDFILMIQFLIQNQIIIVSQSEVISEGSDEIPTWIKTSAQWWGEGVITDMEFLRSIEYLVNHGIIQVQSGTSFETASENNVFSEVVECRVDSTGTYVKVGISLTNNNNVPVNVEYVVQLFDEFGNLLTMSVYYFWEVNPSSTQFDSVLLDNVGNLSNCGIHINKVEES